jgi:hypothetical protein
MAARLDDQFDLVAGALSSAPEKAIASGRDLGLDPSRTGSAWFDYMNAIELRPSRWRQHRVSRHDQAAGLQHSMTSRGRDN